MWDDISLGFALYFSDESESEGAQSCPTFCDPMDCSPSGFSSINGILQARILEWVAIFFSRGSSWPRDQTQVSHIAGRLFTLWATRESLMMVMLNIFSRTCGHLHVFIGKMSTQILCPFFIHTVCFVSNWVAFIFWILTPYKIHDLQIFLVDCLFYFIDGFLYYVEAL